MAPIRSRRRIRFTSFSPFVAFLLIASFGLLFGCKGPEDAPEEFAFTEQDVARYRELAREAESGATMNDVAVSDEGRPYLEGLPGGSGSAAPAAGPAILDLSMLSTYRAIRGGGAGLQGNIYRVTNAFLNVRSQPRTNASAVDRLVRGDLLDVAEFVSAGWARVVTVVGGKGGYVAIPYIAKMTSDDAREQERKKFAGMYYVNFAFVNVRSAPEQGSAKLGEIPGQAIVKPLSVSGPWAKVSFEGKEGYVSMQYLSPFLPRFLVRQQTYTLPILTYRLGQAGVADAIMQHMQRLRQEGFTIWTFRDFTDFLVRQERQDIRLPERTVLLGIAGVTADAIRQTSDLLAQNGIKATLFIETKNIGLSGITEKMMLNLLANGFDLQSAGHTGDDLRALTNAQVALELKQSRQLLESYTRKRVSAIAYPQGGGNDRVLQLAMEAGYLLGVTSAPERTFTRDQLLRLPSFVIFPSMTADEVVKMVKGG